MYRWQNMHWGEEANSNFEASFQVGHGVGKPTEMGKGGHGNKLQRMDFTCVYVCTHVPAG